MRFDILTIFPEMFASPFEHSILKRARAAGLIDINLVNIRDFAEDRHQMTDDYPYGGGNGMVMKPEPIVRALGDVEGRFGKGKVILLSPSGKEFDQGTAKRLSAQQHLVLICGRYEGVDERVRSVFVDEEISIGDYILTGGEFPAMIIVDAVARLVPGVLGCSESPDDESFSKDLLEYPQYTRPPEFEGEKERLQVFEGVVMKRSGGAMRSSFTVRKISYGVGVERTFPTHSPMIDRIDVLTRGKVRRSRTYYLRGLTGKAARIKEIRPEIAKKSNG